MVVAEEFIKYCIQILEINFGQLSDGIINKIKSKKNLNDSSNISDFKEFIDLIELNISVLSGKNKATEICDGLRTKAIEMAEKQKIPEISISEDINKEINTFLMKNTLPTENDVADYAKYIALKYGGNARKVEKEIIEKIKHHVKDIISRKAIKEEIDRFLARFPQPTQPDVDDFINYIHLLKLNFHEDELREHIERERLFHKFHEPRDGMKIPELDQFIDFVNAHSDKKDIGKAQKQELSYLIRDDSGVSDELLSEFAELATPSERDIKDTLEGLGLKHMIKKK